MPDDPHRTKPHQQHLPDAQDPPKPDCPSTLDVTGAYHPGAESTQKEADAPDSTAGFVLSAESAGLPVIPGYTVSGEIARGGMGRVLAARERVLDREVAIKVLLPGASPDSASRFVTESKVTARLPHPGIPPVHALGKLKDGSPFLAMKLVRGRTLADLLRLRETPTSELARWVGVFEQVCQAVGFAHSQGVLHRDLKPANVMVGAFGEVHVMDWGLAKELSAAGTSPSSDPASPSEAASQPATPGTNVDPGATAAGSVMGTPQYMAPEQARGDVVDARADVFALGAILCFLLTGRPPFSGASTIEVLGQAAAGELGEIPELLDHCKADSELIDLARRCLAVKPADRPADGLVVAEAVAEYRAGVEARLRTAQAEQAAAVARAAEQRKRRRVWAIAATAVITVLAIGGAIAGWQWLRAEHLLDRVTAEQQNTEAALNNLTASRDRNVRNLKRVTDVLIPDLVTRKAELTDSDRTFIQGLIPMWQEVAAARGETPDALRLRAQGHFSVANLHVNLGRLAEAEGSYRAALAAYQQLSDKEPPAADIAQATARTHTNLATVLNSLGRLPEALEEARTAHEIQKRLVADAPDVSEYQHDLAKGYLTIANQLGAQGKDKDALKFYQAGQQSIERLKEDDPDEPLYASDLAALHVNLGNLYRRLGDVPKTLDQYRLAVAIYEDLRFDHSDAAKRRETVGVVRMNLGAILLEAGDYSRAERQLRLALQDLEELVAEFPAITEYRSSLIQTYSNLALLLSTQKRLGDSETQYRRALEQFPILLQQSPDSAEYRALLASTYGNLALVLGDETSEDGNLQEAEEKQRAALALWEFLKSNYPDPKYRGNLADAHNHLGLVLSRLGREAEAEEAYRNALSIKEEMVTEFPHQFEYQRGLAGGCCNFGSLLLKRGDFDESLEWFDKAIVLLGPRVDAEPQDVRARNFLRNSYWSRATAFDKLGRTDEATPDWNQALQLSPPRERLLLRGIRAGSRVRAGLAEEAAEEIDAIAPLLPWPADRRYEFACVYALASEHVADADLRIRYADQAMDMLRKAVQAGWANTEQTANDPELNSIRDREEFRQLLADMES